MVKILRNTAVIQNIWMIFLLAKRIASVIFRWIKTLSPKKAKPRNLIHCSLSSSYFLSFCYKTYASRTPLPINNLLYFQERFIMKKIAFIFLGITCALAILFFCNSSKSEAPLGTHSIIENLKNSFPPSKQKSKEDDNAIRPILPSLKISSYPFLHLLINHCKPLILFR